MSSDVIWTVLSILSLLCVMAWMLSIIGMAFGKLRTILWAVTHPKMAIEVTHKLADELPVIEGTARPGKRSRAYTDAEEAAGGIEAMQQLRRS